MEREDGEHSVGEEAIGECRDKWYVTSGSWRLSYVHIFSFSLLYPLLPNFPNHIYTPKEYAKGPKGSWVVGRGE